MAKNLIIIGGYMEKKKKWIIGCSISLAAILLFIVFMLAWNAGLGLPKGFKQSYGNENYYPFSVYKDGNNNGSYSSKYRIVPDADWFFSFQYSNSDNKAFFDFNGDKNYYQKHDDKSKIYKAIDDSILGTLFINQDKWQKDYSFYNQIHNSFFLDGNCLYYISMTSINRFYFALPTHLSLKANYRKYEFYRFNLDNGQNETISLELFVEQLNKYDETIKLNKKLRRT